ncbi:hypothetical protein [Streptomyces spinosirectus]
MKFIPIGILPPPVLLVSVVCEFTESMVDAAYLPEQVNARAGERNPYAPLEDAHHEVQQTGQDDELDDYFGRLVALADDTRSATVDSLQV